jgi:hypothetical protein
MPLPYRIDIEDDIARFVTDNQVAYSARFQAVPNIEDSQLAGLIFDFSFSRNTTTKVERTGADPRIKPTIQRLLGAFFGQEPYNVLFYVCESLDGKHKGRGKLFCDWHLEHGAEFYLNSFRIPTDDSEVVGGYIFRKDHPLASTINSYMNTEILVHKAIKGSL